MNVRKRKPRPARMIANSGSDHELGLWVDYALLRKHQNHSAAVLHDHSAETNNRYLELADIALGNKKSKKKARAASEGSAS